MAQNDFVPFATAGTANVTPQASWQTSPTVSNGFVAGYAKSADANKAIRQPSFVAAAISQWINQQLVSVPILDDGNLTEYINNFDAALTHKITGLVPSPPTLPPVRTMATGAITLYVSPTGNDANDGLSSSTPMQHIQAAVNKLLQVYDMSGHAASINVGTGTYTESVAVELNPLGADGITIETYNGTVTMNSTDFCFAVDTGAFLSLNGDFRLGVTAGGGGTNACLDARRGGVMWVNGGVYFRSSPSCTHVQVGQTGTISFIQGSSYTISGQAALHWSAWGGNIIASNLNITLTSAIAFSTFAWARDAGVIYCPGNAFLTGSGTGYRYQAAVNGLIDTGGSGASYLPGNTAGFVDSHGGQYA